MSLQQWAANGWLRLHRATPQEVTGLLAVVQRDLADADELVDFAKELQLEVVGWLKVHHPELVRTN